MFKVFLTEPIHSEGVKILETIAEIIYGTAVDSDTIIKEAYDCDAILIRSASISREIIEALPKVKVIAKHGIGVDNIDVEAATQKGIMVVNAPEANINAVAEHAFALMMALSKNLIFMDKKVRLGEFAARNKYPCTEVNGKVVGLIGFGRISKLLALKVKSLGVKVLAFDPHLNDEAREFASKADVEIVNTLNVILESSDIISVHVPLTKATKGMINEEALAKMKKGAYLINVARGHIVDEAALYSALKSGSLRGAALDVFAMEPPGAECPLYELDNIILSPHNAALTEEALCAMATQSSQGIVDFLNGKVPKYIVNVN